MVLKNIILHQVIKEEGTSPSLNLSDHVLDNENEDVLNFMDKLIKSFGKKNPTYGAFQEDIMNYPFQLHVKDYLEKKDFKSFTKKSMEILKKEINLPKTVGGYVVFAHYIEKENEYLVTIMLDNSTQFGIIENSLDLKVLQTLDIDRLARANRINIDRWNLNNPLYLAFIKGTRAVSNYFQKFIGNTDLTSSKTNAHNLKNALSMYMRNKKYSDDRKEKINRTIQNYVEKQYDREQDVSLDSISAFVDAEHPKSFITYIQDNEDLNVSGNFRVGRKSDFNFLHKAIVKGDGYQLEFEKRLKADGTISRVQNNIVIKNVPKEKLDEIFGKN